MNKFYRATREILKQRLDMFVERLSVWWGNSKRIIWITIKLLARIVRSVWSVLKELGGISLLFAVITFLIVQYNTYVAIGNAIRADTGANLSFVNPILSDENKEWGYLHLLYDQTYNSNWNYIVQYYNVECFNKIRRVALDIGSLNTLLIQRQSGNKTLGQDKLYEIAKSLKPDFESILNCKLRPWRSRIFYKLY
ncbi:hypothetical protein C4571_00485 [Candidatus Parcubacteria bacterium]|nr:MAG: hypothetical protein C4571_00485 [Candidatus Parcubacteria bacterium]